MSPTECGVSECDRGTSTIKRFRPIRFVVSRKETHKVFISCDLYSSKVISIKYIPDE